MFCIVEFLVFVCDIVIVFFFFKQKTAYEMRISDWSSDVCSSDLVIVIETGEQATLGRVEKMSKSKKNVVDPDDIIEQYGADAVRWFMLSDSPPERDLPWTEAGIEGAWRFINRLWRLFGQIDPDATGDDKALDRKLHQTIDGIAKDIEDRKS